MSFSWTRVRAIVRQGAAGLSPQPLRGRHDDGVAAALHHPAADPGLRCLCAVDSTNLSLHVGLSMLYMLVIPAFLPSTLSAYSVVGEREQGTLEPVLITPIRREEFLIGKALAAFVPTVVIAYAVFGIFLAAAALFAHPAIASAIYAGTHVLVQLLFTPLLAGWGIWVGSRSPPAPRTCASPSSQRARELPLLAVLALMSLNVITVSAGSRSASPPSCWPSTCSPGEPWRRCSTANDSSRARAPNAR